MRAIVMDRFGGPEVLQLDEDFPDPPMSADGVRIQVRVSGVNPTDWKMREGRLASTFPHVFPVIPGWELSGVVVEVGMGVSEWKPGDEVCAYARVSHVHLGTYAEQCVLPAWQLSRKPPEMSFIEAGVLPLAGLTALQMVEAAAVRAGDTVLVQGASGGVGHLALQIAKDRGARVVAVGRASNHQFLTDLGADAIVDHTLGDVAEQVDHAAPEGVSVLLSTMGVDPEELARLRGRRSHEFRMSSIAMPDLQAFHADAGYVAVRPNTGQLDQLLLLGASNRLRVAVQQTFPLEAAAEAQELQQYGPVRGKLALEVS